jgi:hypothetical protein
LTTSSAKTLPWLLKRALLASLVLFLYAPTTSAKLLLKGMLLDTTFAQSDSIVAQILESGELFPIAYGQPFQFDLPTDKSWNICIRDAKMNNATKLCSPKLPIP